MIFLTLSTFLLASFALPLHSDNDSITKVTCIPADFKSVFIFFFANYVAHAATVPSVAGRPTISILWITASLLYPFFGLIRSIILFFHYTLAKDEIGKAISQGAVMVAARSKDWVPRFTRNELIYVGLLREFPENTDRTELPKARFHTIPDIYASSTFSSTSFNAVKTEHVTLSGEASLPKGYFWSKADITQLNALASHTLKREGIRVGRSRNIVKGLASVAQLVFSSITLYRVRGPQLQRYGYTAFGLSVFPYALMSFVNLVVLTIVGEYSTLFVLRTAISDEAKRCGGTISGEIGTLPEESPAEELEGRNLNRTGIGNDGEDGHVTPLPRVDGSNDGTLLGKCDGEKEHLLRKARKTTTGTPPEAKDIGSVGTGGERTDGSGVPMPEDPTVFLSGEPLIAANLRVDNDGVLVITMKGRTGRFKLIEGDDTIDDDPLTFHFHVSALTNQEKVQKREEPPIKNWKIYQLERWRPKSAFARRISLIYILFSCTLAILPYVFIALLTGFLEGDSSTSAQQGWMLSWLVFNQLSSAYGSLFSITDIASPTQAAVFVVTILVWSTPAIGGFVTVGSMLLEFGTCSLSK